MKIILFGSTGMLGKYVFNILKEKYEIICILKNEYDIENDTFAKLQSICNILQENDVIINCAGIIPQKDTTDLKKYIKVNSLFPYKLSSICSNSKCNLIHITTDCVFKGLKGNYTENDIHDGDTMYAVTKSLGECENATIIRTSIIGEEIYNKKSLLEWVISNKNKKIFGYTNHYWNGVTCLTLAYIIKNIIDNNMYWKGIRHIYSPDTVSKYELCEYINDIYNLNIQIEPIEKEYKNLSIKSIYNNNFKIDKIYEQIFLQKKFNLI